jgi:hypothetical protein
MTDLRTMLHEAAPLPAPAAVDLVDADLGRAHRALRRRRSARLGLGSGLAAVAAVGAFAIAAPGVFSSPAPAPAAGAAAGTVAPARGIALVAFTGEQPVGYTLDRVPAGWMVMASDAAALVLGPPGSTRAAKTSELDFEGKIVVMQEGASSVPTDVRRDAVTVAGRPGMIAHMRDGGRTLFVKQPTGSYLAIQLWDGLNWSNDQIVQFGAGVHIHRSATVSAG